MEELNLATVTEQNRALTAALRERDRKIAELENAAQRHDKSERTRSSTVSCLDRHWRQVRPSWYPTPVIIFRRWCLWRLWC
jgi:hypothetical protein